MYIVKRKIGGARVGKIIHRLPKKVVEGPYFNSHYLRLDESIFQVAFESADYMNWLRERARDIMENGELRYPCVCRSELTIILYLGDIKVPAAKLFDLSHRGTQYKAFQAHAQQFGNIQL